MQLQEASGARGISFFYEGSTLEPLAPYHGLPFALGGAKVQGELIRK